MYGLHKMNLERLEVSAYRIPTEQPEADGTIQWDSTTIVLVEAIADSGQRGLGFTYGAAACAPLIREGLAQVVRGCPVENVGAARHCNHKAIMHMDSEEALFKKMGLDYELLDSGCCGMAGAFGLEKGERYEVSIKAGERVLLPAVRNASPETLIIADGFSCREQIAQRTRRRALHTAQVIQMALHSEPDQSAQSYSEQRYPTQPADHKLPAAILLGLGSLFVGWLLGRNRNK